MNKLDFIAVIYFCLSWIGYTIFADWGVGKSKARNMLNVMHFFTKTWMEKVIANKDRSQDLRIVGDYNQSVTFFASTSIFIIAGLVSIIAPEIYSKGIVAINYEHYQTKSFAVKFKTILLILIFAYVFFKNTWSLRQFQYLMVLISSTPYIENPENIDHKKYSKYINRNTKLMVNAVKHFNLATRGYYFGLAALSWYVNPVIFICCSFFVVIIIYRREFMSNALSFLLE